jgi:hypothetical protein
VSPDSASRCHDHPGDEPNGSANEGGRQPEFDDGKRCSGRIGEQANDQPNDSASHTRRESGDTCPSNKHWHATYPDGERLHTPHYRICDLENATTRMVSGAYEDNGEEQEQCR